MTPAEWKAFGAKRPHGTRSRYNGGCRCDECRKANCEYEKQRARKRRRGASNGFVSAAAARTHIHELAAAGVGMRAVADIAGVARSIVLAVKMGSKTTIRAATERAILRVAAGVVNADTRVPAGPVWQMIDELVALGFRKGELARQLGKAHPGLNFSRETVTAKTVTRVQRMYRRLMADVVRRLEVRVELDGLSRRDDEVESVLELRAERRRAQRRDYDRTRRGAA